MSLSPALSLKLEIAGAQGADFHAFDALRLRALTLSAPSLSLDPDSAGWRRAVSTDERAARLAADGLLTGAPAEIEMRRAFFDGEARLWRFALPGAGRVEAEFLIERLDFAGREGGEAGFSLQPGSGGPRWGGQVCDSETDELRQRQTPWIFVKHI